MKKVKYKSSWASYRCSKDKKLIKCDLDELAQILAENFGNIPMYLGHTKAMEIHLLARAYLKYRDKDQTKYKRKKR